MASTDTVAYTNKDFSSDQEVRWCPGCGDYAILKAVQKAMPNIGIKKENIVFVSGILMDFIVFMVGPLHWQPVLNWLIQS